MDETRLASIRIAEAGFCEGDPLRVLEMPVDWALDLINYLRFKGEYEMTAMELNKPSK